MVKHFFTETIITVLQKHFGTIAQTVFESSPLLKYVNYKTRSANRGSRSRSSFANLYAIYVLVEDYLHRDFDKSGKYSKYEGADFTPLLQRMRKMPFGLKLQNHALNNRTNDEFHKYFPEDERRPILRKVDAQKYWINENLLITKITGKRYNIAKPLLEIIDNYISIKKQSFERFLRDCESLTRVADNKTVPIVEFIRNLLAPEKDARIFEIVSYAVLKSYYAEDIIFLGLTKEEVRPERLRLFKTGRTNANDGGIDFVMRPLGRFFQVTETLDVKKYFLDIDKIEKYPISFVIKTDMPIKQIRSVLKKGAREQFVVDVVVRRYMSAIEEIINIPLLLERFSRVVEANKAKEVLDEIIRWSQVEFNYSKGDKIDDVADGDEDEE